VSGAVVTVNPATGEPVARYAAFSAAEVEAALAEVHAAGRSWAGAPVGHRAERIGALAGVLRERRESLARLVTTEMGKPLTEALAEIDKCAWQCEHVAAEGPGFLRPEELASNAGTSYVPYEPLGVVLAIIPWNFPF
jgi:succinate-semialdehyde dehydrogenase/glutarate-semialdehyde dehydrogenase